MPPPSAHPQISYTLTDIGDLFSHPSLWPSNLTSIKDTEPGNLAMVARIISNFALKCPPNGCVPASALHVMCCVHWLLSLGHEPCPMSDRAALWLCCPALTRLPTPSHQPTLVRQVLLAQLKLRDWLLCSFNRQQLRVMLQGHRR